MIRASAAWPPQWKVGVVCISTKFVLLHWTLYQQLPCPKFQRAGNCDEGQLQNELKLYDVVIGTMFRPLFYGIVQPKALLSFGSSMGFFFTCRGSIAISGCMCMKTA